MCNDVLHPTHDYQDEWLAESPQLRIFIEAVNAACRAHGAIPERLAAIRPHFVRLLNEADWLPAQYQEPAASSSMGSGIGMWLLYRAGDGSLAFSALVVPAGAMTPVHDHLAWGLVGLYRGEQVFRRIDDGTQDNRAELTISEHNHLVPGDLYELTPDNDIHQVQTTSAVTSVSLHLLGNDNGCIWRHRYDPAAQRIEPFRSGWLNTACREYQG